MCVTCSKEVCAGSLDAPADHMELTDVMANRSIGSQRFGGTNFNELFDF